MRAFAVLCFMLPALTACASEPVIGSDPDANARCSRSTQSKDRSIRYTTNEPILAIAGIVALETLAGLAAHQPCECADAKLDRD